MIDTDTFIPKDSRWQDIFAHLKKEGFDVYSPGTKTGECTKPYIVVKNNGMNKMISFSSENNLYSVMCYVPENAYSTLEPFVRRVRQSMDKLKPMILYNDSQSPSYLDGTYKAHMVSIEYKNYVKL